MKLLEHPDVGCRKEEGHPAGLIGRGPGEPLAVP
jgi:hypothetical protein